MIAHVNDSVVLTVVMLEDLYKLVVALFMDNSNIAAAFNYNSLVADFLNT
jgi:hypothetical protein